MAEAARVRAAKRAAGSRKGKQVTKRKAPAQTVAAEDSAVATAMAGVSNCDNTCIRANNIQPVDDNVEPPSKRQRSTRAAARGRSSQAIQLLNGDDVLPLPAAPRALQDGDDAQAPKKKSAVAKLKAATPSLARLASGQQVDDGGSSEGQHQSSAAVEKEFGSGVKVSIEDPFANDGDALKTSKA